MFPHRTCALCAARGRPMMPRKASLVLLSRTRSPYYFRSCLGHVASVLLPLCSPLHGYVEVLCSASKRRGPFSHALRRSRRPHRFYCVCFPFATVSPTVTSI